MISRKLGSLWGKLARDGKNDWLPLWIHLADTGEITKCLWDSWLPRHTKMEIASGIESKQGASLDSQLEYARQIAVFLAAVHDIGKASPVFAKKASDVGFSEIVDAITKAGLPIAGKIDSSEVRRFPHALVGECILEQKGLDRSFAVIVGSHHGKPPDDEDSIESVKNRTKYTGVGEEAWEEVWQEILELALRLSGLEAVPQGTLSVPAQVLLSGLLIMADWMASSQDCFALLSRDVPCSDIPSSKQRAGLAWKKLDLPTFGEFSDAASWEELYARRFQRKARPMQEVALRAAVKAKDTGIFIIEAPMGEGKTEAALAVAEAMARRYGLSGIYFALPTQATSDGIFPRIVEWIRALHPQNDRSVFLAHGKSGFNEDYTGIKFNSALFDEEESNGASNPWSQVRSSDVLVNEWTCGRKKGLLADFVAGTIDQVLLAGLKSKHLALRHLGLANKVIILDECHAYDAYMSSYLDLVLSWLGAYHVPVVVLSATLPPHRRKELLQAYQEGYQGKQKKQYLSIRDHSVRRLETPLVSSENVSSEEDAYPLISYTDGRETREEKPSPSGRRLEVRMEVMQGDSLLDWLEELLSDGGCVGIIRNTVKQAQETAAALEKKFGTACVRLLHSRFLASARMQKEKDLRDCLGPRASQRPKQLIVVGTQVMEQSLDVDFDVLFTDICPMDLLLQRLGRLHRHDRKALRPEKLREPRCFLMGIEGAASFDSGSVAVYGRYLLLKTKAFLPSVIHMPTDIVRLVRQAYEEGYEQEMKNCLCAEGKDEEIECICDEAIIEYRNFLQEKRNRAEVFQIWRPRKQRKLLLSWLRADIKEDALGKRGEATVRDGADSLEVLVIREKQDGMYTVPWLLDLQKKYADVRIDSVADDRLAKAIAGCRVSLPSYFTARWKIDKIIEELEQVVLKHNLQEWYTSHWLNGELFLVLDESGEMELAGKTLAYDEKLGLLIKEQEE